ncbi:metal-dependent transcriptional regulator [Pseudarthrobacter sp. R1]|uniref:metal-dependent transcriptional regulator n=1 Tax=Pseudarthrobacter sp. R1 TaxID=2944934 RepID=UPI0035A95C15
MPLLDLSSAAQDYLKLIWMGAEHGSAPVTVGGLAKRKAWNEYLYASEGVRKLAEAGRVTHARYGHMELTAAGREQAVVLVRRHRLLETFLVEILGYGWDEVHDEADVLEHAESETLIGRIDRLLRCPARQQQNSDLQRSTHATPDGAPAMVSVPSIPRRLDAASSNMAILTTPASISEPATSG